jgi:hypothetical protein
MVMVLSCAAVFAMEHNKENFQLFNIQEHQDLESIISQTDSLFEWIVPDIKALTKKSRNWKEILDTEYHTEHLLCKIDRMLNPFCTKSGFDMDLRCEGRYLHKELAAALLGTPGAIACGKRYIQMLESKKRLEVFLFDIVRYGHQGQRTTNYLTWEDEDFDVVRAALDMGIDPRITNSYGTSLLKVATHADKQKIVELLRDHGAVVDPAIPALITESKFGCNAKVIDLLLENPGIDVNVIDSFGKTPLILVAQLGYVEIVKTLLIAKAAVWLRDGYDKTALDYAQECLSNKNNEQKKEYEIIVQLLKNAGAK